MAIAISPQSPTSRLPQRGGALLTLVATMGLAVALTVAGAVAGPAARLSRERASDRALATARQALIAHAAARPIDRVVGPGYLPCPDLDDDGWAESTCGSQSGDMGQWRRLGRLPWKTLGLDDLRDGHGERLWYAVSSKHKGLLNCTLNEACLDMSPDSALGTLTVRDPSGAIRHDGRIDDLHRLDVSGAVAVVFAPGPPLPHQRRDCEPGRCDARGQCLEGTGRAAKCDPANFLDRVSTPRVTEDNADFVDRNDAGQRAGNINGFIAGPVRGPDGTFVVNDRLAAVTYGDLMPLVMRRVAQEVVHCLRLEAAKPGRAGRPPAPAPLCRQGAGGELAWRSSESARFGRVPELDDPACNLGNEPGPHWWRAWRDHVFYALAPAGAAIIPIDDTGAPAGPPRPFAILVAGAPLAAAGQSRTAARLASVTPWLEGAHRELPRLNAGQPIADCAAETSLPACDARSPCDRVVAASATREFNDVVALGSP